jgi:hypothetical protein
MWQWQQVNIEIWYWKGVTMATGKYRNMILERCILPVSYFYIYLLPLSHPSSIIFLCLPAAIVTSFQCHISIWVWQWQQVNIEIWYWKGVTMATGKYRNMTLEGCDNGCRQYHISIFTCCHCHTLPVSYFYIYLLPLSHPSSIIFLYLPVAILIYVLNRKIICFHRLIVCLSSSEQ